MANGKLVKMLIMTNVNRYLEFKQVPNKPEPLNPKPKPST